MALMADKSQLSEYFLVIIYYYLTTVLKAYRMTSMSTAQLNLEFRRHIASVLPAHSFQFHLMWLQF